ncbi:hypothetical protein [Pseudofrankia inefficax]|uniref:hypothetical protein n=1 Tax=Pseudofrankia inefficax (strain DSM 45817 / CECT 9037 / DDB 130130 / EuI1c) TaxID=298654 RepID=UPI0012FE5671|nr:hypothetical protein [Pseudofrankia inefficax]
MVEELRIVAKVVSDLLVKECEFTKKGNLFLRRDSGLLRTAVVSRSKWSHPGSFGFDVSLNLGIAGLSSSSAARSEWVVSASLNKIHRMRTKSTVGLEISGDPDEDAGTCSELSDVLRSVSSEFLLRSSGPADLIDLVCNGVADFKRLDLWPWNELPRLELACVYLEFIGETQAAAELQTKAGEVAASSGVDYFPSRLQKNIIKAAEMRATALGR